MDDILRKSNSCPLDGYVIYSPLTRRTSERKTSFPLSDSAKAPENNLKDLFIPGVALRDRSTEVTPSEGSLNFEARRDTSAAFNTPEKLSGKFQGLRMDTTDPVRRRGKKQSQKKQAQSESGAHSLKKTAITHSPASPNKSTAVRDIREQPQLNLFIGSWRPESGHIAAAAPPGRRTTLQPKRTGVVAVKGANNRHIAELKMTGVLMNTQHQREAES